MKHYYAVYYDKIKIVKYENDFELIGREAKPEDLIKIKQIIDALDPILKGEEKNEEIH